MHFKKMKVIKVEIKYRFIVITLINQNIFIDLYDYLKMIVINLFDFALK